MRLRRFDLTVKVNETRWSVSLLYT